MRRTLILLVFTLVFAACSPTPSPEAASVVVVDETKPPATPMPLEAATQVSIVEEPSAVPPVPVVTGELSIQVISPLDQTVLNASEVDVIGAAPVGTVVSVNEEIVLVREDGSFKVTLSLEEGPNLIEIVASDINGSEVTQLLTVVYEP
jgi:hypothetical protein